MTEEAFLDTLKRVLAQATAEVEDMVRKKMETKWTPERLRALAYTVNCIDGSRSGIQTSYVAEALACAADEIERLAGELRWAFVRASMRANKKGGVTV